MSTEQSFNASSAGQAQTDPHVVCADRGKLTVNPLVGAILALAAGIAAWALIGAVAPVIPRVSWPTMPSGELAAKLNAEQQRIDCYNGIIGFGLFGAILGGAMAVGEGLARRSLRTALGGGLLLAVVGAAFGGLAGVVGHVVRNACGLDKAVVPLGNSLCLYVASLATLGGGIGLGLGLLTRRVCQIATHLFTGILAGGLAGVLYPVLLSYCLPSVGAAAVIPAAGGGRLLWAALASGLIGLLIPGTALRRTRR